MALKSTREGWRCRDQPGAFESTATGLALAVLVQARDHPAAAGHLFASLARASSFTNTCGHEAPRRLVSVCYRWGPRPRAGGPGSVVVGRRLGRRAGDEAATADHLVGGRDLNSLALGLQDLGDLAGTSYPGRSSGRHQGRRCSFEPPRGASPRLNLIARGRVGLALEGCGRRWTGEGRGGGGGQQCLPRWATVGDSTPSSSLLRSLSGGYAPHLNPLDRWIEATQVGRAASGSGAGASSSRCASPSPRATAVAEHPRYAGEPFLCKGPAP